MIENDIKCYLGCLTKIVIRLLTSTFNASNHTKCASFSSQNSTT